MQHRLTAAIYRAFIRHASGKTWAKNPTLSDRWATNCTVWFTNAIQDITGRTLSKADIAALNLNGTDIFANMEWLKVEGYGWFTHPKADLEIGVWHAAQKWRSVDPPKSGHLALMKRHRAGTMTIVESTDRVQWRDWVRTVPYQNPADYFNTPFVEVVRLLGKNLMTLDKDA